MSLPLDTWRAELGLNPWHFWQLADTSIVPIISKCSTLTFEYGWQGSDAAGRDDLRQAIARAEDKLRQYLGYRIAPAFVETTVAWPRAYEANMVRRRDIDATGRRVALWVEEGYVQALGVEQLTLIGDAATSLTDDDGDGLKETFTLTITVPAGTVASDLAVYFVATDRLRGAPLGERWQIAPVQIAISGTEATIVGNTWLIVRPILYQGAAARALDPTDLTVFAEALSVCVRTTNGQGQAFSDCQALLRYETQPCGWGLGFCQCWPGDNSADPGATGYVVARAGVRDGPNGLITPAAAVYHATTGTWTDRGCCAGCTPEPDRVTVRMLAGYPRGADGQIDPDLASIAATLATAELKRRICACRESNERLHDLQQDLALQATETERYQASPEDINNPFGTRRGHVQAWRRASARIIRHGISA